MHPADHPSPPLTVRLLGQPALLRDGQVLQLLGRHDALLLALLALDGAMPRQRVAELLWPDSDALRAGSSLRQRLFRLRRQAGCALTQGEATLALAPDLAHDLQSLDVALDAGAQNLPDELLAGIALAGLGGLAGRVALWRSRWRERLVRSVGLLADARTAQGRLPEAQAYAERWLELQPAAEAAHRRLIELHYLQGDRAGALAAYGLCVQRLRQDAGMAPSAATETLLRLVRSADPVQPSGPRLAPARPLALTRPPQRIGRELAWRTLHGAVARCRPVLVTGEAGIGKTRLLADLAVAMGGWPMMGARPGDSGLPYALLARLVALLAGRFGAPASAWVTAELARLVPSLGAAAADAFTRLRLQQALQAACQAWQAAGLVGVVLDDLHFADAATLDLLAPLIGNGREGGLVGDGDGDGDDDDDGDADNPAGRVSPGPGAHRGGPLAWVLATRPGEGATSAPAWRARATDAGWLPVVLTGLDTAGVQALIETLQLPQFNAAQLAAPLLRSTGGNPLFLLQTLAAMVEQGLAAPQAGLSEIHDPLGIPAPAAALALIERRIGLLSVSANQLLRLAAVAGRHFNAALAARLLGVHVLAISDAWRELEHAQLLADGALAHDLIREAALRSIPAEINRLLHHGLAQALATDGVAPALLAPVWAAAQCWPAAASAFEAAATAAHHQAAVPDELLALEAALRCHQAAGQAHSRQAAFACELRCVRLLLATEAVELALTRSRDLLARAADPAEQAAALELLAHVLAEQYQLAPALEAARAALVLAEALPDRRLLLLAGQREAIILSRQGQATAGLQVMQRVGGQQLAGPQPAGADFGSALAALSDEERLLWLADLALMLDYADRRTEALGVLDRTIAEAELAGRWLVCAEAWGSKSIALLYLGRLQPSLDAVVHSIACSRRAGIAESGLLIEEMGRAGGLRDLGRFADYLPLGQRLPQALRAAGYPVWAINAENDLALAYAWLGRPDLAWRTLTALAPATADDALPAMMRAARLLTLARLARDFGVTAVATAPAQLVRDAAALIDAEGVGRSHVRLRVALELARDLAPADALRQVAEVEAEALARENHMLAAHAALLRTRLLLAQGQHAGALAAADTLLALCAANGPPPAIYPPELWWVAYQALAGARPQQAAGLLAQAVAWIDQTAQQQLPALYRSNFLERNPINVAIRQASRLRPGVR